MFETDNEIRSYALNMWANYIETGDVTLTAVDAEKLGRHYNALSRDQHLFVVRLRDLAIKEMIKK